MAISAICYVLFILWGALVLFSGPRLSTERVVAQTSIISFFPRYKSAGAYQAYCYPMLICVKL